TYLLTKTWEHFYISLASIALGIFVAVPLGILLSKVPKFADRFISFVGIMQTIPSLAILEFFIPIVGIVKVPPILALSLYSILTILRNTYIGVRGVDQGIVEARIGMGMSGWQEIVKMKLPLAVPMIMAGIRISTVYLIGWAALEAFIVGGVLVGLFFDV